MTSEYFSTGIVACAQHSARAAENAYRDDHPAVATTGSAAQTRLQPGQFLRPTFLAVVLLLAGGWLIAPTVQAQVPSVLDVPVTQVVAGFVHTCALTTAGGVQCWGRNTDGQLGDGSQTNRVTPIDILAGQAIAFAPPATVEPGDSFTLSAAAASGRAVSFDTWTPATCSIAGSTLSVTGAAGSLCGVRASQPGGPRSGGGSDAAAPQELRIIRISDSIFANGFDGP